MAVLAIDAGTSVVKAVLFGDDGRELALARAAVPVLHPAPERSEQSMHAVWEAVAATVREVLRKNGEPVIAIATTAQGDGCWLVDEDGRPTGDALLWNDGRAAAIVEHWRETGAIERSKARSGSVTYPGLCNALLAWLEQHEPDRLGRSRSVLSCNGWLHAQMTGRIVADISDASNPFGALQARSYAEETFAAYGLGQRRAMFPPIVSGDDLRGELQPSAAAALGLPPGTPVVMAPYDIVTTAYGAGAVRPGQACLILGTTLCPEVIAAAPELDSPHAGTTIALDDGLFLRAMPTLAGCETLEWAARVLQAPDLVALGELAAACAPGGDGLLFLPYLSPGGERSPFLAPGASGSWHGLKLGHGREHMARAVYEGLSFVIRECLAAAAGGAVREVRVCGGGARSAFWCQMIADVTAAEVLRPPAESEIGARGAWLFSQAVLGRYSTVADAAEQMPLRLDRFTPDGEAAAIYGPAYRRFLLTRDAAREVWSRTRAASQGSGRP